MCLVSKKKNDYHVSLSIYILYDTLTVNPCDVARRDRLEFFVESVLDHRRVQTRTPSDIFE